MADDTVSFVTPYTLGIDLGTTSIKVAIVDAQGSVVENVTVPSNASVESNVGEVGSEQCASLIWAALHLGLKQLEPENQIKVRSIGISGQMHGLLLWQGRKSWHCGTDQTRHMEIDHVSHLYTWQDRRCSQEFLASLPECESNRRLSSGYGCATYLWLLKNQRQYLAQEQFDCAGTVMDFVVAAVCDLDKPVTSDQLAASFGYFNIHTRSWNTEILLSCGFPVNILPEIHPAGQAAGHLIQGLEHIPAGTPVLVAMGDMQCGVLATTESRHDAMLNIGTSIQMSMCVEGIPSEEVKGDVVELVPYFNNAHLVVAAGLNGGNALMALVGIIQQWLQELGLSGTMSDPQELLQLLLSLGKGSSTCTSLQICPTIFGERHDPDLLASVKGISAHNVSLGAIFRAASEGIVDNIFTLLPLDVLLSKGVTRIVGSGSVLSQNVLVLHRLKQVLTGKVSFVRGNESDAAFGAAKAAQAVFSSNKSLPMSYIIGS